MRRAPELVWALVAVAVLTVLYRWLAPAPTTAPGALVGHGLGVLGFLLMLATETLYAVRKRVRGRAWGPMRTWLRAHIFTGIVGSYMVLLHGSWVLAGLAGWTMLATVVVVTSGFVGRYLYTALPRTADGDEDDVERDPALGAAARRHLARMRRLFALWHVVHVPLGIALFVLAFAHIGAALYFAARLR
jgi:hypothetical protein